VRVAIETHAELARIVGEPPYEAERRAQLGSRDRAHPRQRGAHGLRRAGRALAPPRAMDRRFLDLGLARSRPRRP
jgi:hypothetical protein